MISGLIDELNKSADEWNGSNMFELARMCREAADTIWQLRDDLQRANTENAKLRELCAGLWSVMWACAEQRCPHRHEDCFVVNGNGDGPKGHGECWYERRMRELGVEVDG